MVLKTSHMGNLEDTVDNIEMEFSKNPNLIWTFLEEDDLLIVYSMRNHYIVSVLRYDEVTNRILVKFVYSLTTDTFYKGGGWENPEHVERSPTTLEVKRLRTNLGYLKYLSDEVN